MKTYNHYTVKFSKSKRLTKHSKSNRDTVLFKFSYLKKKKKAYKTFSVPQSDIKSIIYK